MSEAEEGYKWLAMVKRENPDAWKMINEIFDAVDVLWHNLEILYPVLLAKQSTSDELRLIIRSITNSPSRSLIFLQLTMDILYHIKEAKAFGADNFDDINDFVAGKTPRHFGDLRSRLKRSLQEKEKKPATAKP